MASVTNLATASAATGKSVLKTMVAIFKEEADTPRVLGESEAFIAYTLKNRRAIRLICRANNERGAFRLHESPVHDLRFVNFHSNVAASASSSDFYVWVAVFERGGTGHGADVDKAASKEGRLTVKPYFKLADKVVINTFHFFINPANNMPDLLVLYGKTAAVLESSKLISEYSTNMLEAKLSAASRELRQLPRETSLRSMCTTFSGNWLAFTSEATKVMACTLRNTTTPAWSGCEGDEIVQLSFVGSNAAATGDSAAAPAADSSSALLAVSSKAKVCVWKLTGVAEPVLLRIFTFGSIVTMLTSRNAMAIFNADGKLARVQVRGDNDFDTTVYEMGGAVRPTSVCYHESARFATVLVDAVKVLDLYQLATSTASPCALSPTSAAAKEATAAAAAPAPRSNTTPFVDPSIISTGIPFRPATSSYGVAMTSAAAPASSSTAAGAASSPTKVISSTATNTNPITALAAYNSARSALQNATLPQSLDGLVASAVYQGDEALRRAIDGLLNVVKNITQILLLTPDQLTRDHQQLISLALEAQMTELQQTTSASVPASAPASPATNSQHSEAFNSYALAKLLAPVASEIATGVTRGVRDTLRTELDAAVNGAFNSSIRVNQKEVLRRRLEEALQETPRTLGENAAKWIDAYIERELSESLARMNASMSALEEENRKLQAALTQIVNSGVIQEVEAMRLELAELRAAIRSGEAIGNNGTAAGAGGAAAPSPQTVIETAEKYIKDGRISQGLSYVVMTQNARCCVQLLDRLSEDDVARVVSDTETTEATWVKLITQMCEQGATETASELEKVAAFLFDVLSEHDEVIAKKTAKAQQVRSDVRHLIARARSKIDSNDVRRVLKDLEKSIQ
ncbi:immunodominant antigen, putative [Leishmania tarentolae]|uniref:Immunodominant antigen, putative n=1 Tax=Leishmania tarentolae TaxID=5689 RepID=A0A640KCI1_LEITA|nr:immunodominant antigen, putative [Leishmania tarentolae]